MNIYVVYLSALKINTVILQWNCAVVQSVMDVHI